MKMKWTFLAVATLVFLTTMLIAAAKTPYPPEAGEPILSIDHFVPVKSTVPALAGQTAEIYVRERRTEVAIQSVGSLADRVVIFIHGAGTPSEVAFDVPYSDYSWMAFLANEGFDVFSLDTTGYGRSTRPTEMNDTCNLSAGQQKPFASGPRWTPCPAAYPGQITTIASDWNDIDAVVNYVRALRNIDRVTLVGWSLGGPRAGGYAGQHPERVQKLVLLAPAYSRTARAEAPAKLPAPGIPFNTQSRPEFIANWDRQVGCPAQHESAVADTIWSEMLASDPVGATWGTGVRRAPATTTWGWTTAMVAASKIPTLLITGAHDAQVPPQRVRDLYDDIGSTRKVLIDLGCSSHNAMWEKNHLLLFQASLEWLEHTSVNGIQQGIVKLGY